MSTYHPDHTMKKIAILLSVLAFACSSSPSKDADPVGVTVPDDASTFDDAASDAGARDSSVSDAPALTLDSCISGCGAKYPAADAKNKQLDATCFLGGACESVCNNLKAGKLFEPNVDAGGCDTASVDSYPITTTSQACSDCLSATATCCAQWISIFGSTDGRALNACSNDCYTKFPAK